MGASATKHIEDYGLIGNFQTAALVSKFGSIDWLCLPRFDSGACFASLLGNDTHGHWSIAPVEPYTSKRKYIENTLILETEFTTESGVVRVTDCMPPQVETPTLIRMVKGIRGVVPMRMELVIRFDYGSITPWVTKTDFGTFRAVAGPDTIRLRTTAPLQGKNMRTFSDFELREGETVPFVATWTPSHSQHPYEIDSPDEVVGSSIQWWHNWISKCQYKGRYKEAIHRSLITLKALTYQKTGGIVAAPTTSLPECMGSVRNWDYRYCWLRDSTLTLYAFLNAGFHEEAQDWRNWLIRAAAGTPSELNIMYGLGGERRLTETEIPWLQGFNQSKPVRVGNAAHNQFQLDVYGELLDAFHLSRKVGFEHDQISWRIQRKIIEFIEISWQKPDNGIWEIRGPLQHFTHSKVMAWVAVDRAIQAVEHFGYNGPVEQWKKLAAEMHEEICRKAYDKKLGSFVQAYSSQNLDASLLMLPMVGFLPATDSRILGTVAQVEKKLLKHGFVIRYETEKTEDGLPEGEGAFIACSLWLADNYILQGRLEEAEAIFERVLSIRNDLGLLAEEYDPRTKTQLGNFPQGFSHIALLNTAFNFTEARHKAMHRCQAKAGVTSGDSIPSATPQGPSNKPQAA